MAGKFKVLKLVIAALLGVELGLACTALLFVTMIGYILTGLIGYVVIQFFNVDHDVVVNVAGIGIAVFVISICTYFSWHLVNRFFVVSTALAIGIPILVGSIHLLFFSSMRKEYEVNRQLERHHYSQEMLNTMDDELKLQIQNKLYKLNEELYIYGDGYEYELLFGTFEQRAQGIVVHSIFRAPFDTLALCVFTSTCEESVIGRTFFFNPKTLKVYVDFGPASGIGSTESEALLEVYHELFVKNLKRKRAVYFPEHKSWTETVPSILEKEYWYTTIKEDTARLYERTVF